MSYQFQAQFQITGIAADGTNRWFCQANVNFFGSSSYGFDTNDISIGDIVILQSSNPSGQTQRFTVDTIDSIVSTSVIQLHITYDGLDISPSAVATGTGVILSKTNYKTLGFKP